MKIVTSKDNPLFKQLLKLAQSSRERKKNQQTLIEGIHLAQTYREAMGLPKALVISAAGVGHKEIETLIARCKPLEPVVLSDALFHELSSLETPVGIIAQIETPAPISVPANMDYCVMLEDIQDPGNLGSILRSAAAAGVKHVVLSKGCVFAWSPRVIRAAMGAHFLLTIYEQQNLIGVLENFAGKKLATALRGETSLYDTDLRGPLALMIGNEGAGLSPALAALADETVTIPMPGKMESLNAAAAAAICLFERVRQMNTVR
jgi:RNA methyltransferase, TrmH family